MKSLLYDLGYKADEKEMTKYILCNKEINDVSMHFQDKYMHDEIIKAAFSFYFLLENQFCVVSN
jgi:hypothetical protein